MGMYGNLPNPRVNRNDRKRILSKRVKNITYKLANEKLASVKKLKLEKKLFDYKHELSLR